MLIQSKSSESCANRLEVTSLNKEFEAKKSLALLRPQEPKFIIERKTVEEMQQERLENAAVLEQADMFQKSLVPIEPLPFRFKYQYKTEDGAREGTCQDWETDATFFNFRRVYGEEQALVLMNKTFGEEYPRKGMTFAMGTHSRYPDKWLINGIIRVDEITQLSLI